MIFNHKVFIYLPKNSYIFFYGSDKVEFKALLNLKVFNILLSFSILIYIWSKIDSLKTQQFFPIYTVYLIMYLHVMLLLVFVGIQINHYKQYF